MQCAAIPYRLTEQGQIEVLLVTSRGKGHWILPKGKVEPGMTPLESAVQEVYEEAGVRGMVNQALAADFDRPSALAGVTSEKMRIFALEVDTVAMTWPEMFQRQRQWLSLKDAMSIVRGGHFREALKTFASIMMPII